MPFNPHDLITVGVDIFTTTVESNGSLLAQTGDVVSQSGGTPAEIWGPCNIAARPAKPIPGKSACQAVSLNQSDRDILIGFRDTRGQEIYGNLSEGETCIYAPGAEGEGQAKVVLKGDGSITLHTTTDNTHNGSGCYLRIGPNIFEVQLPFGRIVFDPSGLIMEHINGASISLGAVSLPGPLAAASSYVNLNASKVDCDAPIITLGPSPLKGGLGYMQAAYGVVPGQFPGQPILGAGVGAVVVAAANSTKVMIGV